MLFKIVNSESLTFLKKMPSNSIHCIVTSPPYYFLRSYQADGQIGLENSVGEYVNNLTNICMELYRVLRPDGIFWLNLGDSFSGSNKGYGADTHKERIATGLSQTPTSDNIKAKDMCMVPARVAIALQEKDWYLRSMIPWVKKNAKPENVNDRPNNAIEYFFMLVKSRKYFYDCHNIKVKYTTPMNRWGGDKLKANGESTWDEGTKQNTYRERNMRPDPNGRHRRNSDWFYESLLHDDEDNPIAAVFNTRPFKGAHFATFNENLIRPMIEASISKAGCCKKCYTPLIRDITRQYDGEEYAENQGIKQRMRNSTRSGGTKKVTLGKTNNVSYITNGYKYNCNCGVNETIPAIVLDPFNGAGTTGVVCKELGLSYIGVDINKDYCELSRKRLGLIG